MKITKKQLLKLIRENNIDGAPWSGTLEDLATAHGKTFGGGDVVDPSGYKDIVKSGVAFTKGKAPSVLKTAKKKKKVNETSGNKMKINKKMLKRLLEEIESEMVQTEVQLDTIPPLAHEEGQAIPGVETREDAWAGGDNLVDEEDWEAASGISNQKEQEIMKITEAKLRKIVRHAILKDMNK